VGRPDQQQLKVRPPMRRSHGCVNDNLGTRITAQQVDRDTRSVQRAAQTSMT
jgi:hypothetical protein